MKVYDFEYDGITLSDMGYILCDFDGGGSKTISSGSKISFTTVSSLHGQKDELVSSEYSECIGSKFQICKIPCNNDDSFFEISVDDQRYLTSWLNRKGFHKFKLLSEEYFNFYFEASFNVNKIEVGGIVRGLELEMITNRPFAISEPIKIKHTISGENGSFTIHNMSDDEGAIGVKTNIKLLQDGDLMITNNFTGKQTSILNCKYGETITLDDPIISTDIPEHKVQDDFNWNFIKLYHKFNKRKNIITISIPCEITITYNPIVKIGI